MLLPHIWDTQLLQVVTQAVVKLKIDWPAKKQEVPRSKLVSRCQDHGETQANLASPLPLLII